MTRDELIEKVARSICAALPSTGNIDDHFAKGGYVKSMWLSLAEAAIDSTFDALREPTDEMELAPDPDACKYVWKAMLAASPLNKEKIVLAIDHKGESLHIKAISKTQIKE